MAHDLLVDPLFTWRDSERRRQTTTLPGALARLASGELTDFPRLRTHQLDPWCMFLAQLAAIALRRAGSSEARLPEDEWRRLLLTLTAGQHEPWCLVVDDASKPAFFQPPVPERSTQSWSVCRHPDDIDVLVTAKGHDVKTSLIRADDHEAWLYALCTLQTTQGYPGRGYNRIARMNGGYGNRPRLGITPDHRLGSRFIRDVDVLLASWPTLIQEGFAEDGAALVWTLPWDGTTSLAMHQLSPHFIEICWRVRCRTMAGGIGCAYTTTLSRRCVPEIDNGDVGDPWIPIERATGKALTVGPSGLDYKLLARVLFGDDFLPAPAAEPRRSDGDPVFFVASALARGQGKTEGLHQRALVVSGALRRQLGEPDGRAVVGRRASVRVAAAANMRSKVLYPALKALSGAGPVVRDTLDRHIDDMFFEHLSDTLAMDDDEARVSFERRLVELAERELRHAIDRAGGGDARRLRAISEAENIFRAGLRKHFSDVIESVVKES